MPPVCDLRLALVMIAFQIVREAGSDWVRDNAQRLGAALAFYSVLSLAPLLVIVLAVSGAIFGEQAARGEIVSQIEDLVGHDGAAAIQDLITHAQRPREGIVATILGIITLCFGASGVFSELQDSLNTIWQVRARPGGGLAALVKNRLTSFAMVLGTAFLLIVSLVMSAVLAGFEKYMAGSFSRFDVLLPSLTIGISLVVFTFLFAVILKVIPDVKIAWRDIWFGAAVTSVLFSLGKYLLGLYLGRSGIASAYGAAGSLVVLVVWTYYSALILFFGAELTQVHARLRGHPIVPSRDAESIAQRPVRENALGRPV